MAEPLQTSIQDTHLICESPSGNVAILLNLGLIDRLRNLINTAPDQEIRAVLLGRGDTPGRNSGRRVVIIDDFQALSTTDNALPVPERTDSNVPVGFFRSRPRKGLYLEDADFSLFREYFSGRPGIYPDVFLAARNDGAGIPTARFFFSPDGVLQREVSSNPFPLDRATLEAGGHSLLGGSMHPAAPATGKLAFIPTTRNSKRLVYGSLGGAMILGALILAAIMNMPVREEASSVISLSVERKANTLRLTWDPDSPAVAHANSGILWISDGDKRRGLELNAA